MVAVVVLVDLDELAKAESVVAVVVVPALRPICVAGSQHSVGAWAARTRLEHTGMVQQEAQLATYQARRKGGMGLYFWLIRRVIDHEICSNCS